MKKEAKKVVGRGDKESNGGSAFLEDSGTQGRGKDQTAPQNGRKPYQFQPGNPYAWKPGTSGNPAGRPAGDIKTITKEFGEQYNPKMGKTHDEHMMELLYRRGCQGVMKAAELWLNYRWGRPNQAIELDTTVNYTEALIKAKERLAGADETIRRFFSSPHAETELAKAGWMRNPALPAAKPTNGHADAATALAAAQLPDQDLSAAREDDAETGNEEGRSPGTPRPAMKVRVEL